MMLYATLVVTGLLVILGMIRVAQFTFAEPGRVRSWGAQRLYMVALMFCMAVAVVLNIVRVM